MKTVFTNGCFDLLHRGHLELLEFCRLHGDRVVVGINSDVSIKKIKGSDRPFINQADRKFLLESLIFVDEVIIFDDCSSDKSLKILKKFSNGYKYYIFLISERVYGDHIATKVKNLNKISSLKKKNY